MGTKGATQLRVGLITTWGLACGVAEYSKALANALRLRGHEVTVLANYPLPQESLKPDENRVVRCFYTGWHAERGVAASLALGTIGDQRLDVVHLQYQSFIYPHPFNDFLRRAAQMVPVVVTFHDACLPPEFPLQVIRGAIVHSPLTRQLLSLGGAAVVPIGIHDIPSPGVAKAKARLGLGSRHVMATVGLGRQDYHSVLAVMRMLVPFYPDLLWVVIGPEDHVGAIRREAESMGLANHVLLAGGFFPLSVVFQWLHAADILLFYFPETGVQGVSSSSCRLGVAARRPVVVSDVGWTRDLPAFMKVPHGSLGALADRIVKLFDDTEYRESVLCGQEYLIQTQNWARSAESHEAIYLRACRRG